MTQGYLIFQCIPDIPITDKNNKNQNEDNELASTHGDKDDNDITENGEEEKIIEEETYDQEDQGEYPSDR